ncbi:radical SAM protein [Candidatus Parcubacteria bacterium]|nr:radical SAM protein [Candidatus Parcubacteria bacterium]
MLNKKKPNYIELEIGPTCLKDCLFCLEGGKKTKRKVVSLVDFKKLLQNNHPKKVVLSGGEPLLNKQLFFYIDFCKEFGVKTISLVSAWEDGFGDDFIKKLLEKGVNEIMLSIEGPQIIHDRLTRKTGSYRNVAIAFRRFYAYKMKYNFRLIIHSNINKKNFKVLPLFTSEFLKKFPKIDCYHLQTLEPLGSALKGGKEIIPKYKEVVHLFSKYLDEYLEKYKNKVRFGLLPYCTVKKKFFPLLGLRADVLLHTERGEITKSSSQEGKMKFSRCKECRMNYICDGIWVNYVKIYGDKEFQPIK